MSHPDHLIAVALGANRSKGAKDPAEWMHQIRLTGGSMLKHGRESRSDGTLPLTEMKLQCFVNFLESTPNFQIKHLRLIAVGQGQQGTSSQVLPRLQGDHLNVEQRDTAST